MKPVYCRLRVLQYVGTADAIHANLTQRAVKGCSPNWSPDLRIYESLIGEFPVRLDLAYIRELLQRKLQDAQGFFPDNDSQRDGYLQALSDLLGDLPAA